MTTVIATRDAMYADSFCNTAQPFGTNKLHKVTHEKSGEDYLMGGCGYLHELEFFARLLGEHGLQSMWKLHFGEFWPPKIMKKWDTDILIVTRSKEIFLIDNSLVPMAILQKEYCIGSGGDWARAHRDLVPDGTYEGAIEYAATRDENTKAPVAKIKFGRQRSQS